MSGADKGTLSAPFFFYRLWELKDKLKWPAGFSAAGKLASGIFFCKNTLKVCC